MRVQVDPRRARRHRARRSRTCAPALAAANVNQPKGNLDGAAPGLHDRDQRSARRAPQAFEPLVIAYKNGAPVRLARRRRRRSTASRTRSSPAGRTSKRADHPQRPAPARRERHRGRRPRQGAPAAAARVAAAGRSTSTILTDRTETVRASVEDVQFTLVLTIVLVVAVIYRVPAQPARDAHPRRRRAALARSARSA